MKRAFILLTGLLLILVAVGMAQAMGSGGGGSVGGPGMPSPADWPSWYKPDVGADNVPDNAPIYVPDTPVRTPRPRTTAPSAAPQLPKLKLQ